MKWYVLPVSQTKLNFIEIFPWSTTATHFRRPVADETSEVPYPVWDSAPQSQSLNLDIEKPGWSDLKQRHHCLYDLVSSGRCPGLSYMFFQTGEGGVLIQIR